MFGFSNKSGQFFLLRFIIGEQAVETLLSDLADRVGFIELLDDTVKLVDSPAALV